MAKLEQIDMSKIPKTGQNGIVTKDEASAGKNQGHASDMLSKLSENFTFKINKPLVPLKIAVFCWFGAGAVVTPFLALYLKQMGLTLKDLSLIYMILPIVQFMGPTISGVIADKIGRSKPVLQANLLLSIVATTCMLFVPKSPSCSQELIQCHSKFADDSVITGYCDIRSNGSNAFNCSFQCSFDPKHQMQDFCFSNYISSCDLLSKHGILHNLTLPLNSSDNEKYASCVKELKPENSTDSDFWCRNHVVEDCNSTCELSPNGTEVQVACENGGGTQIFVISFFLLCAFHTFFSNCYRIIDVTAMFMIKTHKSDFGRQRFWSIMGILVFSPLAGYVITLVSKENGPPRYDTIFYLFDVMAVLTMIVVWKLDVKTEPPSKGLLKKTLGLLKNLDVMVFFMTVFVIGTTWGFTKLFANWYLEELNAPSSLLGLIPFVNSIIGLPFLLTSKWFVSKFGSNKLLIMAFLGYAAYCTGYSFLQNPWWCLAYEVFGVVNYHLLWVTVVTHSHEVAPIGLAATAISIAGGIHFGVGKGSGSLIGGIVMDKYGGRLAFRVMAAVCFVSAILYALYTYARRRLIKKEMDLQELESETELQYEFHEKFTPQILI